MTGKSGNVGLWVVPLERATVLTPWALASLAAEERGLAEGFADSAHGARYAVTRAALRQLLGQYTERRSSRLRFAYGDAGKPRLADGAPFHFNVSHSGDLAIVALSRSTAVGVDLERQAPRFRAGDVAGRLFHPQERKQLAALSGQALAAAVLRCWTMKEAVGKAVGLDLAELLEMVVVDADPTAPPRVLRVKGAQAPERWSLRQISLIEHRALVAVAAPAPDVYVESIRCFQPGAFATN